MNIQQHEKETRRAEKPISWSIILLSFGIPAEWVWSRTMKPSPPRRNMKLDDRPSTMYWPLMRYWKSKPLRTLFSLFSYCAHVYHQKLHCMPPVLSSYCKCLKVLILAKNTNFAKPFSKLRLQKLWEDVLNKLFSF